jgi:hypothetical protein
LSFKNFNKSKSFFGYDQFFTFKILYNSKSFHDRLKGLLSLIILFISIDFFLNSASKDAETELKVILVLSHTLILNKAG